MSELTSSFNKSLYDNSVDIAADLLELPLDEIVDNDIIKNIPVVGTIVKLGKATIAVRDRHLIKKLITFIESINNGDIDEDKLKEHKEQLEKNPKKLDKELGYIMIIIDRQLEIDKTKILAELYKAYINRVFGWESFKEFSKILENLFLTDIIQLKSLYEKKVLTQNDNLYPICMSRLSSIGLAEYYFGMIVGPMNKNSKGPSNIKGKITNAGEIFFKEGIEKLVIQRKIEI